MELRVFIDKTAEKITSLRLNTPAIFLLEAHKPLAFVGSQLLLIAQPVLNIFLPPALIRNSTTLLADSDQLEQLIVKLEAATGSGQQQTDQAWPSTPDLSSADPGPIVE